MIQDEALLMLTGMAENSPFHIAPFRLSTTHTVLNRI